MVLWAKNSGRTSKESMTRWTTCNECTPLSCSFVLSTFTLTSSATTCDASPTFLRSILLPHATFSDTDHEGECTVPFTCAVLWQVLFHNHQQPRAHTYDYTTQRRAHLSGRPSSHSSADLFVHGPVFSPRLLGSGGSRIATRPARTECVQMKVLV